MKTMQRWTSICVMLAALIMGGWRVVMACEGDPDCIAVFVCYCDPNTGDCVCSEQ